MKKKLKPIIIFLFGMLFSYTSVWAITLFTADEILYTPEDNTWQVENTEDALNDLYSLFNRPTTAAANKILSGYTAIVNNQLVTGTYKPTFKRATTSHTGEGNSIVPFSNLIPNKEYLCFSIMRQNISSYTIEGATVIEELWFNAYLDFKYTTQVLRIIPTSNVVSITYPGTNGGAATCYIIE